MIEAAGTDAVDGAALGLILETGAQFGRRLELRGLKVDFEGMSVCALKTESGTVQNFVVEPVALNAGSLQVFDYALQCLFTAGAEAEVTETRSFGGCQLKGAGFVVSPSSQIDRIPLAFCFGKADEVSKECQTPVGLRREEFDVADVGNVVEGRGNRHQNKRYSNVEHLCKRKVARAFKMEIQSIAAAMRSARKQETTREKLIEAAEALFAKQGYHAVSVRMIAAEAGVNWSLLAYHFQGKEGLLQEIYRRHCSTMNEERMRLLAEAQEKADPPELDDVIEAFVRPALTVTYDSKGQTSFSRLRAILAAEDLALLEHLVSENFDFSSSAFVKAFRSCLPALSRDEVLWRFHFMLGTIYYSASGPNRIMSFSHGRCNPLDVEANLRHLKPFLAAAFRAPAASAVKPIRRRKQK